MKLLSEHRCPWCGEVTEKIRGPRGRFNTKKCKSCQGEYICHYNSYIFLLSDILFVILIIAAAIAMTKIVFPIIYLVFYLTVNAFMSKISAYERYEEEETEVEEHKARFVFDLKGQSYFEHLEMSIFLMEKAIFPVCFTDNSGNPISEKVLICIEKSVKRKRTEFECEFSLPPLATVKYNIEPDSNFFFYDGDDKAIGKGYITTVHNLS